MFETKRCKVRRFEERDLDAFISYRNNDEWMKYQSFKNKTKDEYRDALLVPIDLENGAQFAIADRMTDVLLGDLFIRKEGMAISIGYSIHPNYSRKGYTTEVIVELIQRLKVLYPNCKVIAMTERGNIPTKSLLLKLGFIYEKWIEEWEVEVYVYHH